MLAVKGMLMIVCQPCLRHLSRNDLTLRIVAAEALARIGQPAQAAVPAMLERLANPDRENDPRGMEQRILCFSLFNRRGGSDR